MEVMVSCEERFGLSEDVWRYLSVVAQNLNLELEDRAFQARILTDEAELVDRVLTEYIQRPNCEYVGSLRIGYSSSQVSRLVRAADSLGLLGFERSPTKPKLDREQIAKVLERHPHATVRTIAKLAGCSESTIYRANRGE